MSQFGSCKHRFLLWGPKQLTQMSWYRPIQTYIDYSEKASHAFLGEAPGENKKGTTIERVLSHGLGYATSPLLMFIEKAVDTLAPKGNLVPRTEQPDTKQLPMPPKQGGKAKGQKGKPKGKPKAAQKPKTAYRKKQNNTPQASKSSTVSMARRGRGKEKVYEAPVMTGISTQDSGMVFKFSAGRRAGCLNITSALYVGDLVAATNGTTTYAAFAPKGDLTKLCNHLMVAPQNYFYMGAPVTVFTQLFERYVSRTSLEYRPRVATNTNGNFKIMYLEDPVAMYALTGKQNVSYATPALYAPNAYTTAEFAGFPNVSEGSVWVRWSTKPSHSHFGQDLQYTTAPTYTLPINPGNTTAIDVRQSCQGMWAFTGSALPSQGDTKSSPFGEVWINYEIELCDIVTTAYTTAPACDSCGQTPGQPIFKRPVNTLDDIARTLEARRRAKHEGKHHSRERNSSEDGSVGTTKRT